MRNKNDGLGFKVVMSLIGFALLFSVDWRIGLGFFLVTFCCKGVTQ